MDVITASKPRKIIYVDIDNTICKTQGMAYKKAVPKWRKIKKINKFYKQGHKIVYWTSRGQGAKGQKKKDRIRDLTLAQLTKWGCKYHKVKFDKPIYDLFYEDRSKRL